jgi:hypothetical protein
LLVELRSAFNLASERGRFFRLDLSMPRLLKLKRIGQRAFEESSWDGMKMETVIELR